MDMYTKSHVRSPLNHIRNHIRLFVFSGGGECGQCSGGIKVSPKGFPRNCQSRREFANARPQGTWSLPGVSQFSPSGGNPKHGKQISAFPNMDNFELGKRHVASCESATTSIHWAGLYLNSFEPVPVCWFAQGLPNVSLLDCGVSNFANSKCE